MDCLVGLEDNYGLQFEKFTPVDIGLRYEVLDKGQADLSILFTTDAQRLGVGQVHLPRGRQELLPAGNVLFVARTETVDEAGADFGETIESVQSNLTLEVMQELNAQVDIDKEDPAEAAEAYLKEFGVYRVEADAQPPLGAARS